MKLSAALIEVGDAAIDLALPPRLRSMREFAEQEIVLPDGPFAGRRFNCDRQPYTRLWFDAVSSGKWNRFVATGPTQSGKTLACFVIPCLYHLFEIGENVVCGLPDMDMAGDKWREDFEPVIRRSRYVELMPTRGGGSRGGKVESIKFTNGATLKFMSGGGGDKSRAGFTARVLVITETDGMDEPGLKSREADKITQLEARTRAFRKYGKPVVYMECTVSIEEGRTWREYLGGTRSQIALPCPHCKGWILPLVQEKDAWTDRWRSLLIGWEDAESVVQAEEMGEFFCPECGEQWTEENREQANARGMLVHRGQEIQDGTVVGEPASTDTLGFRWSAENNLLVGAGDVAADEWKASRADDDNGEKEMRQFVWALPHTSPLMDVASIDAQQIMQRTAEWPKGQAPPDAQVMTIGVDLGKFIGHWTGIAWRGDRTPHVVDYGTFSIASDVLGEEAAILRALREFRDFLLRGWANLDCRQVWIDGGYMTDVVCAFVRESGERFRVALGRGAGQQYAKSYAKPKSTGAVVQAIGEGYHVSWSPDRNLHLFEVNADHWKSWVHRRLTSDVNEPGAMTLFAAQPRDHFTFAKHLTAEKQVQEFKQGKGLLQRWEAIARHNHFFDATYNACAAGHFVGVRLVEGKLARRKGMPLGVINPGRRRADGRPWF